MVMENYLLAAAAGLAEVTEMVNVDVPALVGVPVIAPVEAPNSSPPGSDPAETDQVSPVPPVAARAVEYGEDCVPSGRAVVVIASVVISNVNGRDTAAPNESVTRTVKVCEPSAVGVPLMTPDEFNVRPGGKVPTLTFQLMGATPPDDCSVCEYADPTAPPGNVVVVIASVVIRNVNGRAAMAPSASVAVTVNV